MLETDEIILIVRQWVQKAENDLTNATFTLKLGAACPTDTVCFHAQQCVEKYLSAADRRKD
jgi:HEPN domain-containing protein